MSDWRETLKRLVETPPIMGLEVKESATERMIKETVGSYQVYIRKQIAVHCDPDVLEQTARKNASLIAMLDEVNRKLESGELMEQKHGRWQPFNDGWFNYFVCSECGRKEFQKEPFCNCGAKMKYEKEG